jgi:hypothetical protein
MPATLEPPVPEALHQLRCVHEHRDVLLLAAMHACRFTDAPGLFTVSSVVCADHTVALCLPSGRQ